MNVRPAEEQGAQSSRVTRLYNMSMAPRTAVKWEILPLSSNVAVFGLEGVADGLLTLLGGGLHSYASGLGLAALLAEAASDPARGPALFQKLDESWSASGVRGAALLRAFEASAAGADSARTERRAHLHRLRALDPLLVLNVLSRTQAGLMVARMQPCFDAELLSRVLESDDPQLLALARSTGCKKWRKP